MASRAERRIVNVAGLVQGIVLVTFPAASTIFTEKSEYGLSSSQYGSMFLPQVALAITVALLGAGLPGVSRSNASTSLAWPAVPSRWGCCWPAHS